MDESFAKISARNETSWRIQPYRYCRPTLYVGVPVRKPKPGKDCFTTSGGFSASHVRRVNCAAKLDAASTTRPLEAVMGYRERCREPASTARINWLVQLVHASLTAFTIWSPPCRRTYLRSPTIPLRPWSTWRKAKN